MGFILGHTWIASVRRCKGDAEPPPEDSERAPGEVSILYECNILSSAESNGHIVPKLLQRLRSAWHFQSCHLGLGEMQKMSQFEGRCLQKE